MREFRLLDCSWWSIGCLGAMTRANDAYCIADVMQSLFELPV